MYASSIIKLGINLKGKSHGLIKTICPKCSHLRKHKDDPCLSVNIDEGFYRCHNCEYKGTVKEKRMKQHNYKIPEFNNTSLSDKAISYLTETRKLSKYALIKFQITDKNEYFPQSQSDERCILFPYFKNDIVVNIKYRSNKKNFKMVKEAELCFYNHDCLYDASDYVVITEGEFDAMSVYDSGFTKVVSVPNGASKGTQKLECLDNTIDLFDKIDRVYLCTDDDEAGNALREELSRRLGKERCFKVIFPKGCKDANEVLCSHGADVLKECIKDAIPYPIENILTFDDLNESIIDYYVNGFPKGSGIGDCFDELLVYAGGQLTTITGIPSAGKSEYIDHTVVSLSKRYGQKFGMFSFENPAAFHATKLMEKFTGKAFNFRTDNDSRMTPEEHTQAKQFLNEHFFFTNIAEADLTVDGILNKAKELVVRKGINGIVIDPYNYIEHKKDKAQSETEYVSEVLTKIKFFAVKYNVHVWLVAHPTKLRKENGKYEVPTLYSISGSAHFFNKTDNGIVVYRDFQTNQIEIYVQKVRFYWMGQVGTAIYEFDKFKRQYIPIQVL